mmetsp:Transcript_36261/g.117234  ORF Transcript_36261/g.117234 Transcript_36261/m.117234 type:complete len:278 (+) Transcript_36261:722-1555(+)
MAMRKPVAVCAACARTESKRIGVWSAPHASMGNRRRIVSFAIHANSGAWLAIASSVGLAHTGSSRSGVCYAGPLPQAARVLMLRLLLQRPPLLPMLSRLRSPSPLRSPSSLRRQRGLGRCEGAEARTPRTSSPPSSRRTSPTSLRCLSRRRRRCRRNWPRPRAAGNAICRPPRRLRLLGSCCKVSRQLLPMACRLHCPLLAFPACRHRLLGSCLPVSRRLPPMACRLHRHLLELLDAKLQHRQGRLPVRRSRRPDSRLAKRQLQLLCWRQRHDGFRR